jgi:hypothetical protein
MAMLYFPLLIYALYLITVALMIIISQKMIIIIVTAVETSNLKQ